MQKTSMYFTGKVSQRWIQFQASVADQGFSSWGMPTPRVGLFFKLVAENCMKVKEFGPPEGRASLAPPPFDS